MSRPTEGLPSPPADLLEDDLDLDGLDDALNGRNFRSWRRDQEYRENIKDDNSEYNNGGYEVTAERHSPHTIRQCRRKQWYREQNAPQETAPPDGVFTIGSILEEEFIEPWIEALAVEYGGYVANSLWLESSIETEVGELTLAGSTDPAIVDKNAVPHALTEVKSKSSLSNLDSPSDHHKAQLHAYLYNAREEHDLGDYPQGYIIYIGKKRLDVQVFRVDFDEEFFRQRVLKWCKQMTFCRVEGILPKADPCQSWECKLCEYRGRCGNYGGDDRNLPWEDIGADGLLPLFDYPVEAVIEYMRSNQNAKLTPTVAHINPGLTEVYDVFDWECQRCMETFTWDSFEEWNGDVENPPWCPHCADDDMHAELSGPLPQEQSAG